ncbi:putative disease resistance protein [Abeliophyllum distichum]|uniref:Disease resistance protein n=1 Tax=Abeliophyllum distichum TaxID=126358 RepID=A0ABD1QL10_9LAMI
MCLKKLFALYVHMDSIPCLTSNDINCSRRIKRFKLFIGEGARMRDSVADYDDNCVILSRLSLSQEWIGWLLYNAASLQICFCGGLDQMFEKLAINSTNLGCFAGLRSLNISYSHSTLKPTPGGCIATVDLVPNLEEIYLHSLSKLESISDFGDFLGLRFSRLRIIDIFSCPQLKHLFSVEGTGRTLVKLEEIRIESCEMLKELFEYPKSGQHLDTGLVAPNLQVLKLKNLPSLETLCRRNESWQHMQQLELLNCNLLRKLPLTTQNEDSIKEREEYFAVNHARRRPHTRPHAPEEGAASRNFTRLTRRRRSLHAPHALVGFVRLVAVNPDMVSDFPDDERFGRNLDLKSRILATRTLQCNQGNGNRIVHQQPTRDDQEF